MPLFKRQTSGSVVCASCGSLVGVRDDRCFNCGRRNPGLWGFAPLLRSLGNDLGFVQLVIWVCGALYIVELLMSGRDLIVVGGGFSFLVPSSTSIILLGASGAVTSIRVELGVDWVVCWAQTPEHAKTSNNRKPRRGRASAISAGLFKT